MGNSHESFTPENIQKGHVDIIFGSFQYQIKNTTFKCKMELNVDPLGPKVIPWLHQLIASLCKAGYVCVFHHLPERCCQVTGTRVPQCCYSYASFPWWSLPAQKQQMPGRINFHFTHNMHNFFNTQKQNLVSNWLTESPQKREAWKSSCW